MIAVNDKTLDLREGTEVKDSFVQEVMAGIALIKEKYGFPVVIKYPDDRVYESYQEQNGIPFKLKEYPAGVPIPTQAHMPDTKTKMTAKWQYFKTTRFEKDRTIYTPNRLDFGGRRVITEEEADLAFFLLFKCPYCGNSLGVLESNKKRTHFVVENRKEESLEKLANMRREDKIRTTILDVMEEEDVDRLLFHWGILNDVEGHDDNDKRLLLVDYVFSSGVKTRNLRMEAFEQLSTSEKDKEIYALIKKAMELGVVKEVKEGRKTRWVMMRGDEQEDLCGKQFAKTMEESLGAYLKKLPKVRDDIEYEMSKK